MRCPRPGKSSDAFNASMGSTFGGAPPGASRRRKWCRRRHRRRARSGSRARRRGTARRALEPAARPWRPRRARRRTRHGAVRDRRRVPAGARVRRASGSTGHTIRRRDSRARRSRGNGGRRRLLIRSASDQRTPGEPRDERSSVPSGATPPRAATSARACERSPATCALVRPGHAGRPHRARTIGVGEQVGDGVGDPAFIATVDEDARLAVDERFARAARVAHDHGLGTGRRLDEHVAPSLHLEPTQARAAGHREDVAEGVVAGQILLGDLAGEDDRAGGRIGRERLGAWPRRVRRRRSPVSPRARGARTASIPRINTSWPLRATSRLTQTTSGRSPSPCRSRRSAVGEVGAEGRRGRRPGRAPTRARGGARPCARCGR